MDLHARYAAAVARQNESNLEVQQLRATLSIQTAAAVTISSALRGWITRRALAKRACADQQNASRMLVVLGHYVQPGSDFDDIEAFGDMSLTGEHCGGAPAAHPLRRGSAGRQRAAGAAARGGPGAPAARCFRWHCAALLWGRSADRVQRPALVPVRSTARLQTPAGPASRACGTAARGRGGSAWWPRRSRCAVFPVALRRVAVGSQCGSGPAPSVGAGA